jgi:hypothetical protein
MITQQKITRIIIDHIEKIEAEETKRYEELGYADRSLILWTKEGDKYELILEADSPEQLEFTKPSDWLSPQLYKGMVED